MERKHTKEPWPARAPGTARLDDDNYARARACVNALAAYDDPASAVAALEAVAHWSRQYAMAIEREFGPQPKFGQGIVGNLHDALTTLSAAVKGGGG